MAIGLGTLLVVLGLVFVLGVVDVDTSVVDTGGLGWILVAAGVIAIVASFLVTRRSSTDVVETRRHRA